MSILNESAFCVRKIITAVSVIFFAFACMAVPTDALADSAHPDFDAARGGLLYDLWIKVTEGYEIPRNAHPNYKGDASKKDSWLCHSCHGWDYKGKDGAAKVPGPSIMGAVGKPAADIVKVLKNDAHAYTDGMLSDKDFAHLAQFVSRGLIDVDKYIDRASGKAKGDLAKGKTYYDTICTRCHAMDGRKEASVGKKAKADPWQAFHKIRNGQPLKEMPALLALDPQIAADILAYIQTLPD
ncbi:MAG: cytochrome c [Rhodospirillales bacterium]|nr:cytochrome c [Rhodospirillales bacterium]MCW8863177.1 cytochrome c [Rhodospirillales bacterium]MCW8952003.1 cytochrome c [Rhodospirillales bacterium]MCW8971564.1 cytochrome c [Rhodospirillales bacterium]MCW9002276.1 cytochrome c [Rhodospirillales bacterium]